MEENAINKYIHDDIKRFCLWNGYTALCRDEPELVSCGCTMQAVTEDTVSDIPENEILTFPCSIPKESLKELIDDFIHSDYFTEWKCIRFHIEGVECNEQ